MQPKTGFTLVEMLVTLSIAAIVIVGSLPAFSHLYAQHRADTGLQLLLRSLALARSEAIKRSARVAIAGNGRWEDGWDTFVDANGDGHVNIGEELLYRQAALSGVTLRGNSTVKSVISYRSDGHSASPNNAFQAGTLLLCPENGKVDGYRIVLARGGRVRSERIRSGSGPCGT